MARIRRQWPGALVIKGILHRRRALAREHGVDGIIVSNHGGRQLDGAVPPRWRCRACWTLPATCR